MKTIPLTQGKVALVDDEDFEWLSKWKWRATITSPTGIDRWYALHTTIDKDTIYMHRAIMIRLGFSKTESFDHVDGNGLNNQRMNLRPCTQTQNVQNRRKRPGLSSKYKGVYWHRRDRKWMSRLRDNGKDLFLGYFKDEEEAGRAYDAVARRAFGEFARLNFPENPKEAATYIAL